MSRNVRLFTRVAALLALLVAVSALGVLPGAFAVTSHKPLNDTRRVGAAPVHVAFPIEYFGLVADLATRSSHLRAHGRAPYGEARFHVRGQWTHWQTLDQEGAQAPGQFTGALVSVDDADAYQVRGLPQAGHNWRAAAINTTDGPTVVVGHSRSDASVASPTCMSRADWGADESISDWAKGQKPTFSPAQVLTVHHTAGSNSPTQNYAATVRAIYSFHVKTRGWADIGYQYLIDGNGVVYEGRYSGHVSKSCLHDGGDGSDFAHQTGTDDVVTGANVENNNSGNVGIALMGCFEPTSSTCKGNTQPRSAAVRTLDGLVASLSARHHIDPDSTVHYVNPVSGAARNMPAVSGHRDWMSTDCPGGNLYAKLPSVRTSTVAFSQAGRTVQEDAGTVRLRVTRTGNTALPATVHYAATGGTADGTSDYTLTPGTLTFAAGQSSRTVPVTVQDDTAPEGPETVVVRLSHPGTDTRMGKQATSTMTIAASDQQPDAWVSTRSSSGYVGNDVYNGTGSEQTKTVTGRRTTTKTLYVRVYNDGNVTDKIAVRGSAPRAGSRVRYLSGSTDITTAMRSTGGWKVSLKPHAYKLVKVRITILRGAAVGSAKTAEVSGTWTGDGTRTDLAEAMVKVVA